MSMDWGRGLIRSWNAQALLTGLGTGYMLIRKGNNHSQGHTEICVLKTHLGSRVGEELEDGKLKHQGFESPASPGGSGSVVEDCHGSAVLTSSKSATAIHRWFLYFMVSRLFANLFTLPWMCSSLLESFLKWYFPEWDILSSFFQNQNVSESDKYLTFLEHSTVDALFTVILFSQWWIFLKKIKILSDSFDSQPHQISLLEPFLWSLISEYLVNQLE